MTCSGSPGPSRTATRSLGVGALNGRAGRLLNSVQYIAQGRIRRIDREQPALHRHSRLDRLAVHQGGGNRRHGLCGKLPGRSHAPRAFFSRSPAAFFFTRPSYAYAPRVFAGWTPVPRARPTSLPAHTRLRSLVSLQAPPCRASHWPILTRSALWMHLVLALLAALPDCGYAFPPSQAAALAFPEEILRW